MLFTVFLIFLYFILPNSRHCGKAVFFNLLSFSIARALIPAECHFIFFDQSLKLEVTLLILETERLFLREFIGTDIPTLHSLYSDAETMSYYPAPFRYEQTESWVSRNQQRYKRDGYGLWAVCLKETDECIGDCGLVKQLIEGQTHVEIGYHIHKNYWCRGFATEAAKACKSYGFDALGLDKLISIIDPANTASIRVAENIGFTREKEVWIFEKMHAIYSGLREE